jgi:undecaprenyl-diphosphatase
MSKKMLPVKEKRLLKILSVEVLLVSLLFIASVFIFGFIVQEVVLENEKAFDDNVFAFFSSFTTPHIVEVMKVFTFLGSVQVLIPAYIILIVYFIYRKHVLVSIDIAILGLSSTALIFILKNLFHRQRPTLPIIRTFVTYSFPSGHMLSSFVFCSILALIVIKGGWQKTYKWIVTTLLFLLAVIIGISRIVLKAHYPTDVIASFCLGIAWVIVSFYVLKKIDREYLTKKQNFDE